MNSWGKHLLLDATGCNHYTIRNRLAIETFVKELVQAIDMKAYGDPQIIHFGEGNKAGYTLVQLIETSNISGHFIEESNAACLDVFSCKDFDVEIVKAVFAKYFSPSKVETTITERGYQWLMNEKTDPAKVEEKSEVKSGAKEESKERKRASNAYILYTTNRKTGKIEFRIQVGEEPYNFSKYKNSPVYDSIIDATAVAKEKAHNVVAITTYAYHIFTDQGLERNL